jgi:hypothetical protein
MRHNYLDDSLSGTHWGVSSGGFGSDRYPLVQLQDDEGRQVRVKMTPEHARAMARDLLRYADACEPTVQGAPE